MSEPWRINFIVVTHPVLKTPQLALLVKYIEDARPGVRPTMCDVMGYDPSPNPPHGRHLRFTIPVAEYERAKLAPKHFIECDSINAPGGTTLVGATGERIGTPISGGKRGD
jgi:hypothetical protein